MKINELVEAGVGKIVKGVNTTPDVQPGETERQAKKLFPMNKDGKPKSLGVPGATPNQAFNLGLVESKDKKDILKGMDAKTVKAINDLMIKFPHAKDPITAIIADIEDSQAISIFNDEVGARKAEALDKKIIDLEKRLSALELNENMSVTGTERRRLEKKKGLKIGSPEWFKHWFDLPYLREGITKQELLSDLKDRQRDRYTKAMLDAMHRLVKSKGTKHSLGSYAFEIAKVFGFNSRELEKMYRDTYMVKEYGPHERYAKVGNTTMRANTRTGKMSANTKVGDLEVYVDNTLNKDGTSGRGVATYKKDNPNDKTTIKYDTRKGASASYQKRGKFGTTMSASDDGKGNKKVGITQNIGNKKVGITQNIPKPKQQLNMSEGIQKVDVEQLEKFADRLFGKVGIDVEFTRHFMDRVNDVRNQKPITMSELTRLFKQEYKRWGKPIAQMGPDAQAVMKDLQTDINLPFVLKWDEENNELDLIAKTVMRKADFKTPNKEFPVEDVNFPSYADIKRNQSQPKMPANPAITDPDAKVRGLYLDPEDVKQRTSNIMYKAGRGLSRLIKGDPNYDPFDQRDAEVQKGTLPTSPYRDGSQLKPISNTQSSIYNPIDMDAMRAEIGAEYGLSANDVLKYSKADQPLPSQIDPKLIPQSTKMPTDAQVLAFRKKYPPVFNTDESEVKENVPTTNKPGSIGQHINWAGKNAPDKPKSNVSVARRKQPEPQSWWQSMLAKGKGMFEDEQLDLKKKFEITDELSKLANIFNRGGHEIRIVGGAVRDLALDKTPKDIDLATDATPQEMQQMFDSAGVRHIPTGIEHGTITAVINGGEFEITTLRADVETDGRRAEVEFVRSWEEDAKRRDLTYNAMSMDFEGNLYDYHGGMDDLQDKVTRFVGDPEERIKEDYLRTLRYFRFQGRLDTPTFDRETMQAIANNTDGLKQLSVERVWMEMSKILGGGNIQQILGAMDKTGVLGAIGLNAKPSQNLMDGVDPIINLARITDDESIGLRWKMSNEEKGKLGFLISQKGQTHDKKWYTDQMADGFDRTQLDALARYNNQDDMIAHIKSFKAPEFPVDGNDLMQLGHSRGPGIGKTLQALRTQWKAGNFSASKDELLKTMNEKLQEDTSIPKYLYKWVDMPQFQKYIDAKKLPLKRGYAHYIESIDDFVKGNSFTDEQHISSWEGNTLIRIDSSTINNKIYPIAGNRTYLQTMHMKNPSVYDDAYLYEPEEIDEYWIAGPVDLSSVEIVKGISEKITKRTPMGDVIDDFYQSDAPQFKGKSKAKRRQMAIAAKLSKMDENFIAEGIMLKLERDYNADMLVLHVKDTKTHRRTEVRGKLGYESGGYDEEDKLHQLLDKIGKAANISDLMNGEIVHINPNHPKGPESIKTATKLANENFADGKKPGRKGLSKRVGIPKGATIAQLEKIAKNSTGEKRRMAQWQLNMRRGKNKAK